MIRRLKVYFDGGCRPNPGPMEAAVVIRGTPHFFDDLGSGSSTEAEWQALFCAVRLARDLSLEHAVLIGDSIQVTREASLALKTGKPQSDHAATLLALLPPGAGLAVRWVKREQNLAGIALQARRAGITTTVSGPRQASRYGR